MIESIRNNLYGFELQSRYREQLNTPILIIQTTYSTP